MTEEELKKVPFRETCHMAFVGEYTTTYMSKDGRLGFCDHVPRDKYGMVKKGGRAVRHFMIDGKVYKSKKKFLEAIKDFNPTLPGDSPLTDDHQLTDDEINEIREVVRKIKH